MLFVFKISLQISHTNEVLLFFIFLELFIHVLYTSYYHYEHILKIGMVRFISLFVIVKLLFIFNSWKKILFPSK